MLKSYRIAVSIVFCVTILVISLHARNTSVSNLKLNHSAQDVNNLIKYYPAPGEEPVYVGGMRELTAEEMDEIPYLKIKKYHRALPESYSNKDVKYLRPVFNQQGGSCAQASGTGYHLTYVLNRMNDLSSSSSSNQFPYLYTWNFLNGGNGGGSNYVDGWELVNGNGIPTCQAWDPSGQSGYDKKWMTGYDKYYSGMMNRYLEHHKIDISTPEGIETLKQWIYDFGDGSEPGGLASFSVNCVQPMFNSVLPKIKSEPQKGWPCFASWGHSGGHAMVIVGWHDKIEFDVSNDDEITTDEDITKDGVVDVKDWEKGGWLVVNTWGTTWPGGSNMKTNGYYYMMYRTGALGIASGYVDTSADQGNGELGQTEFHLNNGGLSSNKHVFVLRGKKVSDDIKRQLVYKVEIDHSSRGDISISSGVSNNIGDDKPEYLHRHSVFNYQGGKMPMQGNGTSTIEIGLDAKDILNHVDNKETKYFLVIDSKGGTGKVKSFSLMDYRGSSLVETKCSETNVDIATGKTQLSITYESDSEPLNISTSSVDDAEKGKDYSMDFTAEGGKIPYEWDLLKNVYYEVDNTNSYPGPSGTLDPDDPDDGLAEVVLGFDFPFYGEKYKKIYVATDGNIFFSDAFIYVRTPMALAASKAIAVLGADLSYEAGDKITYSSSSDKATIRWETKHMWSADGNLDVDLDFAVTIHKNGKIEYFYGSGLSGDVSGMAMGASGGENVYIAFDYGALSDIPASHKTAIVSEPVLDGITMTGAGKLSGKPGNNKGSYRMSVAVTDALDITKVKTFQFVVGGTDIKADISQIKTPMTIGMRSHGVIAFNFGIRKNAKVTLEAFALNGKKIQTVYSGKMKAGEQSIVWNTNSKISNGVYLCKLIIGEESVVKKISVFKK